MRTIDRMMKRITKTSSCWIWTGAKTKDGYGVITIGGHSVGIHRAVYESLVGPIPEGMQLDHLCRNRSCVNPEHLEAVTRTENMRRGKRIVLDMAIVGKIRCEYKKGVTQRFLARQYNTDQGSISRIINGKRWI